VHLVQEAGAKPHPAGVGGVFGESFDLDARLPQRLVEFRLDPAERGGVDGVAQGGHRWPPRVAGPRALRRPWTDMFMPACALPAGRVRPAA
jgi:hypothetical protein